MREQAEGIWKSEHMRDEGIRHMMEVRTCVGRSE